MKQERKFLRQCAVCKAYKEKKDLIRITKDFKTGIIKINDNSEVKGRSIYLCNNETCLENALKKKKIEASLKTKLTENIKNELYTVLKK